MSAGAAVEIAEREEEARARRQDDDEEVSGSEVWQDSGSEATGPTKAGRPDLLARVMVFGCLGMLLFGYDTGIVSGAMVMVKEDIEMNTAQTEEVVSVTLLFAAISTVVGIPLNSQFGRKPVVLGAAVLYAAGSMIIAFAGSYHMLLVGRSLLGVAIGFASGTVPMYSAEMAPSALRGTMVTLNDLNIVVGQLLASLLNVFFSGQQGGWRWSMGLAAAPAAVLLVGFMFLPESPRWLATAGKLSEAEDVLRKMEGDKEAKRRLQDIVAEIRQEKELRGYLQEGGLLTRAANKFKAMWCQREVRRAAVLGISLMAMNQLSGINTVMYYSTTILMKAGFSKKASIWLAAVCCVAQLLGVVVSVCSMDRGGRRVTALRSTVGVVVTLLLLAVTFSQHGSPWNELKVAGLMLYLIAFGSGLSGVPWVVNSEIYPLRVRSAAVGQATVSNWLFNYLVGRYFLNVCELAGTGGAFAFFAGISVLGGIWLYAMLPETMGLPLESIEVLFQDPYPKTCHKGESSIPESSAETETEESE